MTDYIEYTVRVFANGDKFWYMNDQLHREDGPAIEHADGNKFWWINGKKNREDGPAVEYANGDKYWYLDDKNYSEKEYWAEIAKRKSTCEGKIVEIDGKKYKLTAV